jgi:alkyl hydroperoxide reductase subunit AhpC
LFTPLKKDIDMKTIGEKLDAFSVAGVKPGFNQHEENGVSAFEEITEKSFSGKWKVIYFWPKDLYAPLRLWALTNSPSSLKSVMPC